MTYICAIGNMLLPKLYSVLKQINLIFQAIKTRFADTLESRDALLAAVSMPKFKLWWVKEDERRERTKELLSSECRTLHPDPADGIPATSPPAPMASTSSSEMDFFSFEAESEDTYSADKEVMDYLRAGQGIETLNQFPRIRNIFLKYNTPTPSSAPVERLFSLGNLVLE